MSTPNTTSSFTIDEFNNLGRASVGLVGIASRHDDIMSRIDSRIALWQASKESLPAEVRNLAERLGLELVTQSSGDVVRNFVGASTLTVGGARPLCYMNVGGGYRTQRYFDVVVADDGCYGALEVAAAATSSSLGPYPLPSGDRVVFCKVRSLGAYYAVIDGSRLYRGAGGYAWGLVHLSWAGAVVVGALRRVGIEYVKHTGVEGYVRSLKQSQYGQTWEVQAEIDVRRTLVHLWGLSNTARLQGSPYALCSILAEGACGVSVPLLTPKTLCLARDQEGNTTYTGPEEDFNDPFTQYCLMSTLREVKKGYGVWYDWAKYGTTSLDTLLENTLAELPKNEVQAAIASAAAASLPAREGTELKLSGSKGVKDYFSLPRT